MNLSSAIDSTGNEEFVAELRSFLDQNLPDGWGTPGFRLPRDEDERRAVLLDLQDRMAHGRWVGIHWPEAYGGRSATLAQQVLYHFELTRRGVPALPGNRGLSIVGPTLIRYGTPEQQQRFLDPLRHGQHLWAGGFSEPEAGSDLAGLRTRGVIDNDVIRINGQKIWTSSAHWCNWIFTLVRTNPSARKHEGLSVVLVPLDSPGVDRRPIRQITGAAHFNEIFFDNVEVPLENILGPVDEGWRVNRTTLSHEHFTLFIGAQSRFSRSLEDIIRMARVTRGADGVPRADDLDVREKIARAYGTAQLLLVNGMRNVAKVQVDGSPGPEGSIMKLFGQESEKSLFALALDIGAGRSILSRGADGAIDRGKWQTGYLGARAATIGGGTSEIHKNKIAENVLSMPRDPWAN